MTKKKLIDTLNKWDTECEINHEEFLLFIEAARTTFGNETDFITKKADLTQPAGDVGEALRIADMRNEEVKELDFGEVFWACGVLAKQLRALSQQPDAPTKLVEILGLEEAIHFADNYGDWATVEGYKHFRNLCRTSRAYLAQTKIELTRERKNNRAEQKGGV